MTATQPARYDYAYERNGPANLFMLFAPFVGGRQVNVTDRRTKQDWAWVMKDLVDSHFEAKPITVVEANLNTHKPESLYQTFAPQAARRLLDILASVYTPKHGSWLNMAELVFSRLSTQCFDRRLPDNAFLETDTNLDHQP